MSDFLSNLAVRSSGSAEAIQPRLPSLFEPLRPSVGSIATPNFMAWEQNGETPEETIRQSDSPKVQGPSSFGAPRTEGRVEAKPATPRAPDAPRPVQSSLFRPGGTQPDPDRPQTRPAFQASGSQPAPSQPPVRESLVAALPTQPDRNIGERLRQAATAGSPTRGAGKILSAEPLRSGGPATPVIESPHFPADRILPLAKSSNMIEPRVASRAGDSRRGDPSWLPGARSNPSEPAIQVTIGRIEVRAAAQQPPPPTERSASPVMGLDEYLRQKRAGA
jgi:hypothetical protein